MGCLFFVPSSVPGMMIAGKVSIAISSVELRSSGVGGLSVTLETGARLMLKKSKQKMLFTIQHFFEL